MTTCMCSRPDCKALGCRQQRNAWRAYGWPQPFDYAPPDPNRFGQAQVLKPLTEDDVRRIVREELKRGQE